MTARPRVTFGIIVLNGEPFTAHAIRSLYPFAHEIIVVEGAAPGAVNIATADGHSRDGTLDVLRRMAAEEDPEGKLTVVTAEDDGHPDGFWPGEKHEQSRAYARRATGDYLWQVDIDEFYLERDMERVLDRLAATPTVDAMSFRQVTFWGGLGYVADGWYLRRGAADYHRLFRWGPGFEYATHRPPTVRDETGRDLRKGTWLDAATTAAWGVRLYHYSLLLPQQVIDKCDYYATADWARRKGAVEWANERLPPAQAAVPGAQRVRLPELARAVPRTAPRRGRRDDGPAARGERRGLPAPHRRHRAPAQRARGTASDARSCGRPTRWTVASRLLAARIRRLGPTARRTGRRARRGIRRAGRPVKRAGRRLIGPRAPRP